jgi:hypothetical protein
LNTPDVRLVKPRPLETTGRGFREESCFGKADLQNRICGGCFTKAFSLSLYQCSGVPLLMNDDVKQMEPKR